MAECDGEGHSLHALVDRADQALYEAKRSGKNRVVTSPVAAKEPWRVDGEAVPVDASGGAAQSISRSGKSTKGFGSPKSAYS